MSVNGPAVSAGEAFDLLLAGWHAQEDGTLTASWMLHGRPGVGKTQVVEQLARAIGADLFDLRLTTIEPQDLRGLPYYDHAAGQTVWYPPEDLPSDPDRPSILFLDELTAASPYLQPTVYGLLQERRVGRHALPRRTFVVAAGNAVEDGATAYEMGTALSDRLVHLVVRANAIDWVERYAAPRGLDPAVIAFLRGRPDLLETTEAALARGEVVAATPRSWERVSAIMGAVQDRTLRNRMIAGTVGTAIGAEFAAIADDVAATLRVDEMLTLPRQADRWALYPLSLHGLNALVFALVGRVGPDTIGPAIEVLAGMRDLPDHTGDPAAGRLPVAELTAFGFELLIPKALGAGLEGAFATSPAYAAYAEGRRAAGLPG